ncbi:MAG: AraC family transcriptional regulator [Lachnospiraceae bacterium]|nr:AraC family transcriptional regulator [Lachnospiraceae bacterium]
MAVDRCNVQINRIQKELKAHGTSSFPVGFYYDYLPVDAVPWHWHEQLELAYVKKGRLCIGVNSDKFTVKEGESYFINKEQLHSCWCEEGDSCTIYSAVFKADLLGAVDSVFYQRYLLPLMENSELPCFVFNDQEKWQREVIELNKKFWTSAENEDFGFEFQIRENLSKIVLIMIRHMSKQPKELSEKAMRTERRMKSMLTYIGEHYGNEIKIEDIAESAAISESECVRCFRDSVGISPIKYVKQFRIQNAADLLVHTDRPINDIAEQCGFQDMSYFTRSFREAKGITPTEFRKSET